MEEKEILTKDFSRAASEKFTVIHREIINPVSLTMMAEALQAVGFALTLFERDEESVSGLSWVVRDLAYRMNRTLQLIGGDLELAGRSKQEIKEE